jgi:hypothetical protein
LPKVPVATTTLSAWIVPVPVVTTYRPPDDSSFSTRVLLRTGRSKRSAYDVR